MPDCIIRTEQFRQINTKVLPPVKAWSRRAVVASQAALSALTMGMLYCGGRPRFVSVLGLLTVCSSRIAALRW